MFTIKSTDSETELRFEDLSGDYFTVALRSASHSAQRQVYAYTDSKGIAHLLEEAAQQWQGWAGTKTWQSIEEELKLELIADNTGHITLKVRIAHDCGNPDPWCLESTITIEAGQLASIANDASNYFGEGIG